MDYFDQLFEELSTRLKAGKRFGLRMQAEGEGRFKHFQGQSEIPELKKYLENARKEGKDEITIRDGDADDSVINQVF